MTYVYDKVKYKRKSDAESKSDANISLFFSSTVPFLFMNQVLRDVRDITNTKLSTVVLDAEIYDPDYEKANDGEKRFEELGSFGNFNGDVTTWLYDKKYNHIFAVKFLSTVEPRLVTNRSMNAIIYPVCDPGYNKYRTSNLMLGPEKKLAEIYFNNNDKNTKGVSYILKGDDVTRTSLKTKIKINDNITADVMVSVNNFLQLDVNSIDLDKTDTYILHLIQANHDADDILTVSLTSDVDKLLLPLDI